MSKKIKPSEGDRIRFEQYGEGSITDIMNTGDHMLITAKIDGYHPALPAGRYLQFYYSLTEQTNYPSFEIIAPAKKLTQRDYISLSLAKGESISNKNAYAFCGTMKLSTRIGEIEKAHNVAFKRTPEQHILKCNGRKGNHTVYSLDGALSEQSTEFQNYIKSLTQ